MKAQDTGVGLYDKVFHALDRWAAPFDRRMAASADPPGLARHYREAARPPMKLMSLLSSNARAFTVFLAAVAGDPRSEEHTSELQSLMRISYAVFCLKKQKQHSEQ